MRSIALLAAPLAAAVLLLCALSAPGLAVPLDRDEGEYAWAARLWSEGGLPYRDTFLQKPPGIVAVYGAVLHTIGISPVTMHVALLVNYLCVAIALAWTMTRLRNSATGVAAAVLFCLSLLSPLYESKSANTEAFMIGPVVLALGALSGLRTWSRPAWMAAFAGIAFGAACLTKQVAAAHFPLFVAVLLLQRASWRLWTAFAAGCVAPLALTVGYFAAHGALAEFLECTLFHNLEYVGNPTEGAPVTLLIARLHAFSAFDISLWVLAVAAVGLLAIRRQHALAIVLACWFVTALVGVSAGGYYRGHYLLQALPVVCALAATLVDAGANWQWGAGAVLAVLWWMALPTDWRLPPEQQAARRYQTTRFGVAPRLGAFLRDNGGGSLLVLASEAQIYFYAGLQPVTRYVISDPLFGGYPTSPARQKEVLDSVERMHPTFIVMPSSAAEVPIFSVSDRWLYTRISQIAHDDYRPVAYTTWSDAEVHPMPAGRVTGTDLLVFQRREK